MNFLNVLLFGPSWRFLQSLMVFPIGLVFLIYEFDKDFLRISLFVLVRLFSRDTCSGRNTRCG